MFIIQVPYINLQQIYDSQQSFRWRKLEEGSFFIVHGEKGVRVKQQKDRLILDCNENDFFKYWYGYLDLQRDYMELNNSIKRAERELRPWAKRADGIHILRQDLFEVIISSMLMAGKSKWSAEPPVASDLEFICDNCGVIKKTSVQGIQVKWHLFPTPEQIVRRRKLLQENGLHGCAENIIQFCQDVIDGWVDFGALASCNYLEAMEILQEYDGINRWIAERICCLGLGMFKAYPLNKTSGKLLQEEFDCKADEFDKWYLRQEKVLRNNRGLIALWAMYNAVNPPKQMGRIKYGND